MLAMQDFNIVVSCVHTSVFLDDRQPSFGWLSITSFSIS